MSQFALACASHTPLLMNEAYADAGVCEQVARNFKELGRFIEDFAPDQIIQFAPDHFHGFHYDLMPSFCVGTAARSFGDWGTQAGKLKVDEEFALALLDAVRDSDIDLAVSFDMVVDHGFVQLWETLFESVEGQAIIPLFINAVGHPLPKFRRARLLGEAVGRFAEKSGRRVLFVASGGLSHDPVVPRIQGASPELRERLIGRQTITQEHQAQREMAVYAAAALAMQGKGPAKPLNPEWDREFLGMIRTHNWPAIDALIPDAVAREAGAGAAEVLAWAAAAAAMNAAAGGYEVCQENYLPIPGWIAGMAIVAALPTSRAEGCR